ncbi:MAG: ABC-F family ATP-binding cassette domain-containing protein [Acholeplasmataceae bacterium]
MSVLDVTDITFSYGDEQLYNRASMRLFPGEHAVLVGPNGSGKTTLLKLLERSIKPDTGSIRWSSDKRIGYLDQYASIDEGLRVKEYLYAVFLPLFEKEERMVALYETAAHLEAEEQKKALFQAANLSEELIESDFYGLKSKIGNIIHGLGLEMSHLELPIARLSGGMRAKIILGKLLLEEADVLLLDEPTNFLDVRHIDWLTKFLNDYQKAFIVVSHHEAFVRAIARTVFALEHGDIVRYKGDYDFYLKERELRSEQHEKAYASQKKRIDATTDFIRKNIVRASTTKRAKSRRKMLEKIVRLAPPRKDRTYQFFFPLGHPTGRDVLVVDSLEFGYDRPLVDPLGITIRKEEKVVITGKNGIGKSTFIKTVMGLIEALDGTYRWIDTAEIAYFEQESSLPDERTPFEVVHSAYPHFTKREVMSLLGNHGIDYDMAIRRIRTLSGGEKTKIRLALLRHQKGNVLVLDEPTNHLDAEAREALKSALIDYSGTLILVSHDEEFYRSICDYAISFEEVS